MSRAKISAKLRQRIAEQAKHRCGYCLTSEKLTGIRLTIDHIIPLAAEGILKKKICGLLVVRVMSSKEYILMPLIPKAVSV